LLDGDLNASADRLRTAVSCASYAVATDRQLLARFAETREELVEPASGDCGGGFDRQN
jgi:hypothetical protein